MRNAKISILTSLECGMKKYYYIKDIHRIFSIKLLDICLFFSQQLQTYDLYVENIYSIFEYYFDNHVYYGSMFDNI